jgi:hypothetical protein
MTSEIATYFSKLYYSKDTTNKNKFKLGKIYYENNDLIAIIFGKPRGNYFNRHFGPLSLFNHVDCDTNEHLEKVITIKENVSCGGFRIKWNITKNTYQYICASKMEPCGCGSGGVSNLYISTKHNINIDEQYSNLKNNVLNNIRTSKNILSNKINGNSSDSILNIYNVANARKN